MNAFWLRKKRRKCAKVIPNHTGKMYLVFELKKRRANVRLLPCFVYALLLAVFTSSSFFGSYRSHQEDSKAKITTKTHHTSVCALAMLTDRFGVTRLPVICIQIVSWCMWKRRKACDPWNTFCPIITVALKYNRLVAKHNIY